MAQTSGVGGVRAMDVYDVSPHGIFRPESTFLLGCGLLAVVLLAMPLNAVPKSKAKQPSAVNATEMGPASSRPTR